MINELPCPMKIITPILQLPSNSGKFKYKWPLIMEAYNHLIGNVSFIRINRRITSAIYGAHIVYALYSQDKYQV